MFASGKKKERRLKQRHGASVDAWGCRISSHVSLGRTESGKTRVSTGFLLAPMEWWRNEGSRSAKRRKGKAWSGKRGSGKGTSKGEVGQWPVNHRHDVMTRLSFQRLHRRKSFVRSCLPYVSCHTPVHPRTGRFLLQESIRWLQESGGFYVKILQKIMVRYIPSTVKGWRFVRCTSHALILFSFLFFCSFLFLVFSLPFSLLNQFRITMHKERIPLIAGRKRSALNRRRKLVGRQFIL